MMSKTKRRASGYDQLCKDIENDVRDSGRSVLCIGGEADSPPFAYTVGNAHLHDTERPVLGVRCDDLHRKFAAEADDLASHG